MTGNENVVRRGVCRIGVEGRAALRTPFAGDLAEQAAAWVAFSSNSFWARSTLDGTVTLLTSRPDDATRCAADAASQTGAKPSWLAEACAALSAWLERGELTDAGREMAENALVRDPLEVEEFEDYLEAVVDAVGETESQSAADDMVRERLRLDGRTAPEWWHSERTSSIVLA